MRKLFHDFHLWLSIPLGIIISIICLTGALLVFEQDITQKINEPYYKVTYQKGAAKLQPADIVYLVATQVPDSLRIATLEYGGGADDACKVTFTNNPRRTMTINPYTGQVIDWVKSNTFFSEVRKLHRWLLNPPAVKGEMSVGKMIVGITTLLMVVIILTGLFIWIPRNNKALFNRLKVSFTKGWRRFWYDLHVSLGFYALIFLLIMALTGLTWSFKWYNNAAYALFGVSKKQESVIKTDKNQEGKSGQTQQQDKRQKKSDFKYTLWNRTMDDIDMLYPEYQSVTLSSTEVKIIPKATSGRRISDTAKIDPETGAISQITNGNELPLSQTLKGWFFAFHTGSWGGIYTKIIYFIAGLIGFTLPLTGYYMWWKKRKNGNRTRRKP